VLIAFSGQYRLVVADYSELATPPWVDTLVQRLKDAAEQQMRAESLDTAGYSTTSSAANHATVNLFEKILIPTAKQTIQKIRIFLGDADRAV